MNIPSSFDHKRLAAAANQQRIAGDILREGGTLEQIIVRLYRTPMSCSDVNNVLSTEYEQTELNREIVGLVIRGSSLMTQNEKDVIKRSTSNALKNRGNEVKRIDGLGKTAWTDMRKALLLAATECPPTAFDRNGNEMLQLTRTTGARAGSPNYYNVATILNDTTHHLPELLGSKFNVNPRQCVVRRNEFKRKGRQNSFSIMSTPSGATNDEAPYYTGNISGTEIVNEQPETNTIYAKPDPNHVPVGTTADYTVIA